MAPKSLAELYDEHQGKVSDKWSIYLNEYDRLFGELRYSPVSLLEIGIQNGGSLEIWAQYFPSATKIVGCDINPDCGLLQYDDPRIAVVIGDVNTDTTQADIVQQAQVFHVIIDDGSHLSSDIIKSFARYFPYLEAGGLFVVEDLHCSYWQEYEGGLFDPFSSIAFFKRLADIVSYEHWGLQKQCTDTLEGFFSRYAFQMQAETLLQVHSVEFLNSLCIIRKARPEANRLGTRIIAGSEEKVISGHLVLQGGKASPAQSLDQTGTLWAVYSRPLDEEFLLQRQEIAEREAQIGNLTQSLVAYKGHIAELTHTLQKREVRIADLTHTL
ncbi:MAG: class I SAM-dependent methyltransferase, partial [Candidatus Tectimicrobiota bacterium]